MRGMNESQRRHTSQLGNHCNILQYYTNISIVLCLSWATGDHGPAEGRTTVRLFRVNRLLRRDEPDQRVTATGHVDGRRGYRTVRGGHQRIPGNRARRSQVQVTGSSDTYTIRNGYVKQLYNSPSAVQSGYGWIALITYFSRIEFGLKKCNGRTALRLN